MALLSPRPSVTLPFLMIALPATFVLFQGKRYCEPLCFQPTLTGVVSLAGVLVGAYVVASSVTVILGLSTRWEGTRLQRWLFTPSRPAIGVLLALFGVFLLALTADSLDLYEAVWKPMLLPLSFPLFAPVWVLYGVTFPLSVVFSVFGVESTLAIRLVVRATVVVVGFSLSAVWQTLIVSILVDGLGLDQGSAATS
jgi:hypothetical protein